MESTVRGFEKLSRGRLAEAARCWLEAHAAFPMDGAELESLSAASSSNAGAARLLLGHDHEAGQCFDAAQRSWRNVIAGIATLDVPMSGSSSFHFRLAAKAPEVLVGARRERYRQLADAAFAITQFNHVLINRRAVALSGLDEHATGLRALLRDILGNSSPEARLLSASMTLAAPARLYAVYADKLYDITTRRQTYSAALSEPCANLESAASLTALLVAPILQSTNRFGEDAAADNTDHRQHEFE